MKVVHLALLAFASLGSVAHAGQIGIGGFSGSETVTTFNGLGLPFSSPAPLVFDGNTYTTDTGSIRYTDPNSFDADCNASCIGNDSDLGFFDVVLGTTANRVGALIGGANISYTGTVDFYDTGDNLLGSIAFGANAGLLFTGWEDLTVGIKRVRFTDTASNGLILHMDDFRFESVAAVPVPGTLPVAAMALACLAWARRRQNA